MFITFYHLLYKTRTAQILSAVFVCLSVWMVLELPLLCQWVPEGMYANFPVRCFVREHASELAGQELFLKGTISK